MATSADHPALNRAHQAAARDPREATVGVFLQTQALQFLPHQRQRDGAAATARQPDEEGAGDGEPPDDKADAPVIPDGTRRFLWFSQPERLVHFLNVDLPPLIVLPALGDTEEADSEIASVTRDLERLAARWERSALSPEWCRALNNYFEEMPHGHAHVHWWGTLDALRTSDETFIAAIRAAFRNGTALHEATRADGSVAAPITDEELPAFAAFLQDLG